MADCPQHLLHSRLHLGTLARRLFRGRGRRGSCRRLHQHMQAADVVLDSHGIPHTPQDACYSRHRALRFRSRSLSLPCFAAPRASSLRTLRHAATLGSGGRGGRSNARHLIAGALACSGRLAGLGACLQGTRTQAARAADPDQQHPGNTWEHGAAETPRHRSNGVSRAPFHILTCHALSHT